MAARPITALAQEHLQNVRAFYEDAASPRGRISRFYRRNLARQYRYLIPEDASVLEVGCGSGELLALLPNRDVAGVDLSAQQIERARTLVPHGVFQVAAGETLELGRTFDAIIVSDTLNLAADVQSLLESLLAVSNPRTRLFINYQNHLWRPALNLAVRLGLKQPQPVNNWLGQLDVANLLQLSNWQRISSWQILLLPAPLLGIEYVVNRWLTPLFQPLGAVVFTVARPYQLAEATPRSVSVVVPARNEAGNIEAAVVRTPQMGAWTELIFVEGNSTDDTWAEIQRVKSAYPDRRIKVLQQSGRGKGNAVRDGFAVAEGEILMILDADLTMPPEELPKFYDALVSNRAEFANGSRLVYPMEKRAMRFLNMCANKGFGLLFSWLVGQPLKDTLCGTKVLYRGDYQRIAANRAYFGDFDPFGDFDLLFGASKLSLRIADIPIRYRERKYGETNIQRWRHGWILLRMVMFAARKMKFVA
ncbi:glycosyl transferase [Opitutaceae bacterium EW11]|nr:glycosyl transferase [Opitutaceae bacterium EW11]